MMSKTQIKKKKNPPEIYFSHCFTEIDQHVIHSNLTLSYLDSSHSLLSACVSEKLCVNQYFAILIIF